MILVLVTSCNLLFLLLNFSITVLLQNSIRVTLWALIVHLQITVAILYRGNGAVMTSNLWVLHTFLINAIGGLMKTQELRTRRSATFTSPSMIVVGTVFLPNYTLRILSYRYMLQEMT